MLQVAGYLADWVRIKGYWTTRQTRRNFNCVAFIAQTICMLLAAFFLQPALSVTFITLGVAFASFAYSSFSVNYLDIAPQFAGVLMGICNSFATVAGIVSPILTGYIVSTPVSVKLNSNHIFPTLKPFMNLTIQNIEKFVSMSLALLFAIG